MRRRIPREIRARGTSPRATRSNSRPAGGCRSRSAGGLVPVALGSHQGTPRGFPPRSRPMPRPARGLPVTESAKNSGHYPAKSAFGQSGRSASLAATTAVGSAMLENGWATTTGLPTHLDSTSIVELRAPNKMIVAGWHWRLVRQCTGGQAARATHFVRGSYLFPLPS